MEYRETITLKDGRTCILRSGTVDDGKALLDIFIKTHSETDFLRTYADETDMTVEEEREFLERLEKSEGGVEILAIVDGEVVGSAGIDAIGSKDKVKHRAEFGISVARAFWGLGIGRALTRACIACAKRAGYLQLELDAVADNEAALALYKSEGFVEFGRNPRGFRTREGAWQELVFMRLELG